MCRKFYKDLLHVLKYLMQLDHKYVKKETALNLDPLTYEQSKNKSDMAAIVLADIH